MGKRNGKKKNATHLWKETASRNLPLESKDQDGSRVDLHIQQQGPLILFHFTTPKAQHQALARMESFYESSTDARTYISLPEAATRSLCRNYQAFNLPLTAICEWLQAMRTSESTWSCTRQQTAYNVSQGWWRSYTNPHEACLLDHLSQVGCFQRPSAAGEAPSYLISVTDSSAIPHEVLHALYFLHARYREKVQQVWRGLSRNCQAVISHEFILRGYGGHVWADEFQAYVSEEEGEFGNKTRLECSGVKAVLNKAQVAAWKELQMDIGAFL